jgi:hypothetical protein
MKRTFAILASVLGCSHAASPPQVAKPASSEREQPQTFTPESGAVYVGCGFLLAENHGPTNFTVLLRAKHARQVPQPNYTAWILDGVLVETTIATAGDIGSPLLRGDALLRKHLEWEARDLAKKPGWAAMQTPTIGNIDLGVSFPSLVWIADATGNVEVLGQQIRHLVYVTAAIDDVVFVMAAPLRSHDELGAVGPTLQRSLRTLKRMSQPTNIRSLSAEIRSSTTGWKGCGTGGI